MQKSYIERRRIATSRNVYGGLLVLMLTTLSPTVAWAVDVRNEILIPAQGYVGAAYCHGGFAAPCFDCSGFVSHLYSPHVPGLPRISNDMARFGTPVERSDLRPGDLVFFVTGSRSGVVTHVAVYMGNDSIIHAISDGPNRGVSITPLSARYWRTRYHSARRVVQSAPPAASGEHTDRSIRFADGAYTGELRDGVPHGEGRIVLNNGDEYAGSFEEGAFHGRGVYRWASGERYEGSFRAGSMHGEGVFVRADGRTVAGQWRDGALQPEATAAAPPQQIERRTYTETATSPWDTWDGIVEGDFRAWLRQQEAEFEEWKRNN